MGLFSKLNFSKKKKEAKEINKRNTARVMKVVKNTEQKVDLVEDLVNDIEQQIIEDIETNAGPSTDKKNMTLYRIDILESFATWSATALIQLQIDFQTFKMGEEQKWVELEAWIKAHKANEAAVVWDSTDNTYKPVKEIIINKAIDANQVLYQGGYQTLDSILSTFQFDNAKTADRATTSGTADYAVLAGSTKNVEFNGGSFPVEVILQNYIVKSLLRDVLDASNNFSEFKTNLIKALGVL